jgi:hypothetical protein
MMRCVGVILLAILVTASGRMPWCCHLVHSSAPTAVSSEEPMCACCAAACSERRQAPESDCDRCRTILADERFSAKAVNLSALDMLCFAELVTQRATALPIQRTVVQTAESGAPPPEPAWIRHRVMLI